MVAMAIEIVTKSHVDIVCDAIIPRCYDVIELCFCGAYFKTKMA